MSDRTLLDVYRHELENPRPDHYVHFRPNGTTSYGTLDFFQRTAALADALTDLGVGPGDRVIVLCDTRPEWHMIDIAVLDLGAVNVPIYGTLTPEQVAYQVQDSGARVAIAEDGEQMAKFLEVHDRCPELVALLQLEGDRAEGVLDLDDLMSTSRDGAGERFWERVASLDEDALATIVYTSGTTGEPKGVMLTHRNIVTNAREALGRVDLSPDELGLECLPLCHMIERVAGFMYMSMGASRAYCSVHHVGGLMNAIRPAAFAAVPRLLEKVRSRGRCSTGRSLRAPRSRGVAWRGVRSAPVWLSSTASPTASCWPRSAAPSAARCGSCSAAAPPCRCTSTSSSRPSAYRCRRRGG